MLVTITIDGEFLELDLNVPTYKPMLLTHSGVIQGYDLSKDGKWAATGGEDNVVALLLSELPPSKPKLTCVLLPAVLPTPMAVEPLFNV